MLELFIDALLDAARMIPWLLATYVIISFFEASYSLRFSEKLKKVGNKGPLLGALFGSIPQCGFSVVTTSLYNKQLISKGALLAVYLSTSDEAIPIILAHPDKIRVIIPLLLTKITIAIVAGFSFDFFFSKSRNSSINSEACATSDQIPESNGCCGHKCTSEKIDPRQIIWHPLLHTLKVFVFIFFTSLAINYLIFRIGEESLANVLLQNSFLQPIVAAIIGLIPNCASSVAITEVFLKGGISFGSAIAGLSSNAGLGLLVLFKENRDIKDSFKIIALLLTISITTGLAIQYLYG